MSTATTVSRAPSAWRLGMVSIKPAVIVCLGTVFAQFALNALIAMFFYVTRGRSSENVYMAALNSALVMAIFLLVAGINQTISYMRAGSLSGAPRRTLALSSYVISVVFIALGSVIWWLLILIQPYLFFMSTATYTSGVDIWLIVVAFWIACDGAGRLIGVVSRHANGPWEYTLGFILAIPLGLAAIAAPVTWLVLTLVHKSGYLPPMHLGFWFLGLVTLAVLAAGWRLTTTGRLRRLG